MRLKKVRYHGEPFADNSGRILIDGDYLGWVRRKASFEGA
jgi:uncharacterized protein (DUF3820 family)